MVIDEIQICKRMEPPYGMYVAIAGREKVNIYPFEYYEVIRLVGGKKMIHGYRIETLLIGKN